MAQTLSVRLSDHFAEFVEQQISSGRYASIQEVIEAGLELLEEDEQRLRVLRQAIADGEASGFVDDFKFSDLYEKIDRLAAVDNQAAQ